MKRIKKILIIDDEINIITTLKRILEGKGYYCDSCLDAFTALKKCSEKDFDVILLDIRMPKLNGIEFLKQFNLLEKDSAVIFISHFNDINSLRISLKLGAYDYITKPLDYEELEICIEQALEKLKLKKLEKKFKEELEKKIEEQRSIISQQLLKGILTLSKALEAKDKYTEGHSERVCSIAVTLAKKAGLPKAVITKIKIAALLHDIGKIGIPDSVLNKPGKLTEEEYAIIKTHCKTGCEIIMQFIDDKEILQMVLSHHERLDGTGYPLGLKNESINKGAKIIAIADTFDAITSKRSYRDAQSIAFALEELLKYKGKYYDEMLVDLFINEKIYVLENINNMVLMDERK